MAGVPLKVAAPLLGVHEATIRRWIAEQHCPCVSLGGVGRGHGSRVDVEQVRRWRYGQKTGTTTQRTDVEILNIVVRSVVDTLREDSGHRRVAVTEGQAAGLLAFVYERFWRNFMMRSSNEYERPPEIAHLYAIWLRSVEDR